MLSFFFNSWLMIMYSLVSWFNCEVPLCFNCGKNVVLPQKFKQNETHNIAKLAMLSWASVSECYWKLVD